MSDAEIHEKCDKCGHPSVLHLDESDVVYHGLWVDNGNVKSRMWVHLPTGIMLYEDNEATRDKKLRINPFYRNDDNDQTL